MITLSENSGCEKNTTHLFSQTPWKARQGFALLLMGREGRLVCSGAGTVIYRMAVPSVAGLLSDCHTEAITTWWFSFHSTFSSLRLVFVLRYKGTVDQVLPCPAGWGIWWGVGTDPHQDTDMCPLFTGRCLSWWNKVRDILWHSLLHGWGIYFVQSGCGLDLTLGCSCTEDTSTKAHTLGRRHLSLPFAGLVSLHLCRLPFQRPEYILEQSLGMAEAVPELLCIPSVWPPSTRVGITKGDLVLQQWGVLPTFQTDKCVCFKFKWNAVRSSCCINKAPKAE